MVQGTIIGSTAEGVMRMAIKWGPKIFMRPRNEAQGWLSGRKVRWISCW